MAEREDTEEIEAMECPYSPGFIRRSRNCPNMIRDPRLHRQTRAQGLMELAEVVVGKMQGNGSLVALVLLAEGVR